jgi:hypothetical protein
MLQNISAADPDRVRRPLPTDLGDMSVEIQDHQVICRRFVPTGPVQGLDMSERTSMGEILDDTRRLRRARHRPPSSRRRSPAGRGSLGRALARDPKIPFAVQFTPGMVMVVVHHPREGVTDNPKTCVRIVSSGFD